MYGVGAGDCVARCTAGLKKAIVAGASPEVSSGARNASVFPGTELWGRFGGSFPPLPDEHGARNRGEWCLGLSHAGWSACTQTAFHAGAVHEIHPGTSLGWVVRARGSRWPDVHAHSGSLRFEGEGTHSEPWGSLRLRAYAEVGDRRTMGVASPDSAGRWGGDALGLGSVVVS